MGFSFVHFTHISMFGTRSDIKKEREMSTPHTHTHFGYKSFIFESVLSNLLNLTKYKKTSSQPIHTQLRESSLNHGVWRKSRRKKKHLSLYIETKSFHKTATTLLTFASSFSSSVHTRCTLLLRIIMLVLTHIVCHSSLDIYKALPFFPSAQHTTNFLPMLKFTSHSLLFFCHIIY